MAKDIISPLDVMSIEMIQHFRNNWTEFIEKVIIDPHSKIRGKHLFLSEQQKELIDSVNYNNYSAAVGGRGVSKTASLAMMAIAFVTLYPEAKVILSAHSSKTLKTGAFTEVKKWLVGSLVEDLFEITGERIYLKADRSQNTFIEMRTATTPESLSGIHADNLLIVLDEASVVHDDIWRTFLNTLTGDMNKFLAISNPTRVTGYLYDLFHDGASDRWNLMRFSSLNSPFTNKAQIQEVADKWGVDSNIYKIDVLGEFGTQNEESFIALSDVMEAMYREVYPIGNEIQIAVDVARQGNDSTCWAVRYDDVIYEPITKGKTTIPEVVNTTLDLVRSTRAETGFEGRIRVVIDDVGVGGGATDYLKLKEHEENIEVVPFIANGKGDSVYGNEVSKAWGFFRERLSNLSLPSEEDAKNKQTIKKMKEELSGRRAEYDLSKVTIESKKVFKKEYKRSPDIADAIIMAVCDKKSEKSVVRDFDIGNKDMVIKRPTYCSDYYEYCSIFYSSARTISIVYGRYGNGELIITHEHLTDDNVSAVASHILNSKPTGFKKIIANDKCFGKATRDDIRGQLRRDRIRIKPIAGYDELGAIELLNELTAQNNFKVLNKCHTTADQIYNWRVDTTKFELENNYGLCYAVLGLVFELREFIKPTKKAPRVREAYAPKNDDKSVTDMRSKYIASLR